MVNVEVDNSSQMNFEDNISLSYQGHKYYFKRDEGETNEEFHQRAWLVAKQEPKTKEDYKEANKLARLHQNYYLLGCRYSETLEEKIIELNQKIIF